VLFPYQDWLPCNFNPIHMSQYLLYSLPNYHSSGSFRYWALWSYPNVNTHERKEKKKKSTVMCKHVFTDTVISKQRLNNILYYTGFHETIIATEISTRGGGGGGGGWITPKTKHIHQQMHIAGLRTAQAPKHVRVLKIHIQFINQ
jgi:hypothetical protein